MSSVKKNFLYNVVYQLLLIALPLVTTPYISRVLGADGVGIHSYSYTVANYFMLIAMLGVKNHGNRSIAAVRDDPETMSRTFWEIYGLQLLCSMLALGGYFVFTALCEQENQVIFLIQSIFVLTGLLDISWLFFGLEQFKLTVTRNIIIKLLTLGFTFLLVKTRQDLWKYTLIVVLGTFFSQSYLWLHLKKVVRWVRPSFRSMARHLKPELILFIPVIAVSLYKMMDKIMLRQMSTFAQVGFYENSEKILNIPTGIITALGTVMLPRMANLAAKERIEESRRYIRLSMHVAAFLACGMAFGIAGISPELVPIFLGEEFLPCITLLQILAPTVVFIAWANVIRTQYLIPNHKDLSYIVSVSLGALVNLVINALLIPSMAATGAAIGTLCAEGAVCLCQSIQVRKALPMGKYLLECIPYALLGGAMLALLRWVCPQISAPVWSVVAGIAIGGGAYAIASGLCFLTSNKSLIGKFKRR